MKISLLSKRVTLLVIALVAGCAISAQSAVLFYEDWSGYTAGATAISSGRWSSTKGLPEQLTIVENPAASLTGKFLKPLYDTANTEMSILPDLKSVSTFSLSQGISLSAQVAFVDVSYSERYFRIGVESATNSNLNYWLELRGTNISLWRRTGLNTTLTKIGTHDLGSGVLFNNTLSEFSLNIVPIVEGGYNVSFLLDGVELIGVNDSDPYPSFSNGMRVLTEFRDPRAGYLGTVSVESIPEPSALLLGAGALVILVGSRLRAHRQLPSSSLS